MQKEDNLLITSSLLDAYGWLKNCPPQWRTKAKNSLVAMLRREAYTPHPTAQRGIDFEDAVYQSCDNALKGSESVVLEGSKIFRKVANKCYGGLFQLPIKRFIKASGRTILLYGKTDVLQAYEVIDIKTTNTWLGVDKYLRGWQHKIYLYAAKKTVFEYLVVVFPNAFSSEAIAMYPVAYNVTDVEDLLAPITEEIEEFFNWLRKNNLFEVYENVFSKPYKANE